MAVKYLILDKELNLIHIKIFKGIGREIVKELAKRGGHIIMCCKNSENGEKIKNNIMKCLPKARIDIRQLDLRQFESVTKLVNSIGKVILN